MSKKDKSKVEEVLEPQVEGAVVSNETDAEKLEKFKQMKRDAAQRFKEKRAKEKTERVAKASALIEELKNGGYWDSISEDSKAFLNGFVSSPAAGGTNSTFNVLFGANPKVGDSITLSEAFQKTLKGKPNLDAFVKKWAEKGTVVSFKRDADNILNSTYTIEAIGTAANA